MDEQDYKRDVDALKHETECKENELIKLHGDKTSMERRYLIILGILATLTFSAISWTGGMTYKSSEYQQAIAANTATIAVNSNRLVTLEKNYDTILDRLDKIQNVLIANKSRF